MQVENEDDIIEVQTEENKMKRMNDLDLKEERISTDINKYEFEYDRTLSSILFNLQQRQEQKDL